MSEKLRRQQTKTLAKPDAALADYLDTLLAEIDGEVGQTATATEAKAEIAQADKLYKDDLVVETVTTAVEKNDEEVDDTADIPAWAETPFQVLMFTLGKVRLAVPLSCLNGILKFDKKPSQLPGQPDWSMGVLLNHDNKVVVVDAQQVLMPEQMEEAISPSALKHVLLIGEGTRGLAVEAILGTEILDQSAIRWRSARGVHPWYAGIVVEKLTVMIDVDGLLEMLAA